MPSDDVMTNLQTAARAAAEKKAFQITGLEVSTLTSYTDHLLICSGASDRQVGAIADAIQRQLRDSGVRPIHVEGANRADWVLIDYGDFVVEPSFGTHFFQNLITFGIAYLTINSSSKYNLFDWDWLNAIEPVSETEYIRHVRLKEPLEVLIDGRSGKAVVFKNRPE